MTLLEFLSDRLGRLALQLICIGLAALFLFATGTQPGVLIILLFVLLLIFAAAQIYDFSRQRAYLRELESILDSLDQKYLFAECVPPPQNLYARRLFNLTRRAGRAMTGAVSDAQASQREYREYVERWVHEIKAPITAARLICRDLDGDTRRKLTAELGQIESHVERALFYARAENPEQDCLLRKTELEKIAAQVPFQAKKLAEHFWPGPLTMIFGKRGIVPAETTGGLNTVAVRMPSHPVALSLIRAAGGFIAAPSANTSGRPSPTLAEHVAQDMDGRIPLILDGGAVGIGIESTIIDFSEEIPMVLRPGYITPAMIKEVIGQISIDPGLAEDELSIRPKAPGMKYRHYAPSAPVVVVDDVNDVGRCEVLEDRHDNGPIGDRGDVGDAPTGVVAPDQRYLVSLLDARLFEEQVEFGDLLGHFVVRKRFAFEIVGQSCHFAVFAEAGFVDLQ